MRLIDNTTEPQRVTLVVFGREDARREWLREQATGDRYVRFTDGVVIDAEGTTLTRVVQDERDYPKLMGLALTGVIEHPSFVAPDGWRQFIACRIRRKP